MFTAPHVPRPELLRTREERQLDRAFHGVADQLERLGRLHVERLRRAREGMSIASVNHQIDMVRDEIAAHVGPRL